VATVRIRPETKKKLDTLKVHPRETYNELISRLADAAYDNGEFNGEEVALNGESGEDIGRNGSLQDIMKVLSDAEAIRSRVE